jgi:hypothetical protein
MRKRPLDERRDRTRLQDGGRLGCRRGRLVCRNCIVFLDEATRYYDDVGEVGLVSGRERLSGGMVMGGGGSVVLPLALKKK